MSEITIFRGDLIGTADSEDAPFIKERVVVRGWKGGLDDNEQTGAGNNVLVCLGVCTEGAGKGQGEMNALEGSI